MDFLSPSEGSIAYRYFHATTDGGKTWSKNDTLPSFLASDLDVHGDKILIVGSPRQPLLSTNGGAVWIKVTLGDDPVGETTTAFWLNDTVGFVGGEKIYKTADGGLSWTELAPVIHEILILNLHFYSETHGIALGSQGRVVRTTDGGLTWSLLFDMEGASSAIASFGDTSYVASSSGRFYRLYDRGQTWERLPNIQNVPRTLVFENTLHGYAGGINVLETTDGGVTWTDLQLPSTHSIQAMQYFPESHTLIVAGDLGLMARAFPTSDVDDPSPQASRTTRLTIADGLGRTVYVSEAGDTATVDEILRGMPTGLYLWHAESESGIPSSGKVLHVR